MHVNEPEPDFKFFFVTTVDRISSGFENIFFNELNDKGIPVALLNNNMQESASSRFYHTPWICPDTLL